MILPLALLGALLGVIVCGIALTQGLWLGAAAWGLSLIIWSAVCIQESAL